MAIFNSYVSLPEGRWQVLPVLVQIFFADKIQGEHILTTASTAPRITKYTN